jgi:hypothetical protein
MIEAPFGWMVQGDPSAALYFDQRPGMPGYGRNPRRSLNKTGGTAGADYPNALVPQGTLEWTNITMPPPTGDTVFDTPILWDPICFITNLGVGMDRIDASDARHLQLSGRLKSGENLMVITRDSASSTRAGAALSTCTDPSFAVGENIGPLTVMTAQSLLGANFTPSNKGGSGNLEGTVINHRLGIGYTLPERGVTANWLTMGRAEILAVRNDLIGGGVYSRPTLSKVLDPGVDAYIIGKYGVASTVGDPLAEPPSLGGTLSGNPPMRNPQAAAFVNQITSTLDAFAGFIPPPPFTPPGHWLIAAGNITANMRIDTMANWPYFNDPCMVVANPKFNPSAHAYVLASAHPLNNPAYSAFGSATLNGRVPTRTVGVTYTDGVINGTNYRSQGGVNVAYGAALTSRNRICGDFNGDAQRNWDDSMEMLRAWRQRNGGPFWVAPNGTGAIAGTPGADAIIDVLGDYNGDGNFNLADIRYWCDGLGVNPGSRAGP